MPSVGRRMSARRPLTWCGRISRRTCTAIRSLTWRADDQMPEARAMNVSIFLDEVNEFNGPLMFIPGSHKLGVLEAEHDLTTTSYPLWTINHETIGRLVDRGG